MLFTNALDGGDANVWQKGLNVRVDGVNLDDMIATMDVVQDGGGYCDYCYVNYQLNDDAMWPN